MWQRHPEIAKCVTDYFSKTVELKKDASVQHPNASEYTLTIVGWKFSKFAVFHQNILMYSGVYSL